MPEGDSDTAKLRGRIAELERRVSDMEAERSGLMLGLEQAPVGLEIYDRDGLAVWLNSTMVRFLGLPSRDVAIGKFNVLTDPFSAETGMLTLYERAYRGEAVHTEEFTIDLGRASESYGTSSKEIWFRMQLQPIYDSVGSVSGMFCVIYETTQERFMQETLRVAQRQEGLEVLAGGVAHDFNNLLTAILGNASLLSTGIAKPENITVHAEAIESAAEDAALLTRQLMAYAGKGRGAVRPVDVVYLVKEIGKILSVTVGKTATLEVDVDDAHMVAHLDEVQMKQVIMNLITNAHASLEGKHGTVRVSSKLRHVDVGELREAHGGDGMESGEYVCIDVSDTGCGMDATTARRAFEPYFTTKEDGHGLGLAAAIGIVRSHHGALHVQSTPGAGTRMRVILPPSDDRPAAASAPAPVAAGAGGRVLVVDDEAFVRSVVTLALSDHGFEVAEAENGREALAWLRADGFQADLVILDVMMPVLNGIDTHREIRAQRADLPVLMMSGHADTGSAMADSDPYTHFLVKPFTARGIVSAALEVCERDAVAKTSKLAE